MTFVSHILQIWSAVRTFLLLTVRTGWFVKPKMQLSTLRRMFAIAVQRSHPGAATKQTCYNGVRHHRSRCAGCSPWRGSGGRVRPAVQRPTVSEVASEPKPEPYPWVNPPHRTTQEQAPPSFLNSCHMLGGKQLTGSWSVKGGGGRGLKVWGKKMLITAFLVRYCWFRHAPAVAFVASCYWFNERGEIWRQQVSN